MTEFPQDIKFKFPWRGYQQRVLDDLKNQLSDAHLHIIAPPGSGKTVLGLEVALRLNKPTLILAPTLAIRDQWIDRFCELFLQTSITPDWISRDIHQPKFLTVTTYQGLHAACAKQKEEDPSTQGLTQGKSKGSVIKKLAAQKVKTIVADEAHHLKKEWWATLTEVKANLNPTMVELTATPPYDVTGLEWQRYVELNGPVDTEIFVPELVKAGDLCPHQDYVYCTFPNDDEWENINAFRKNAEDLFQKLRRDPIILKAIKQSAFWLKPQGYLEWIYSEPAYFSACLVFLHDNGETISPQHLDIIGDKHWEVPEQSYSWMEILLEFYLYGNTNFFGDLEGEREALQNQLRRFGVLEQKQIRFFQNRKIAGALSSSTSKLQGISEIVDFEYGNLGKDLRMVILTDFIRKEFLVQTKENRMVLNKIGVMPIFEKLRRENGSHKKIGVLSGSLIIIPATALERFKSMAEEVGVPSVDIAPLAFDADYIEIKQSETLKHHLVALVTRLFGEGNIEILIGTKSLLGEGWDAPGINALILASFVGSFVQSNQMRGRAIRTEKGNLGKTGNIWHLACVDPSAPDGGGDFEVLQRRFRSFTGVSFYKKPTIENGIGRLDLPEKNFSREETKLSNEKMFARAENRENLRSQWNTALEKGIHLVEEIKIPFPEDRNYQEEQSLYLQKTILYLVSSVVLGITEYISWFYNSLGRFSGAIKNLGDFHLFFQLFVALGLFFFAKRTFRALGIYLKYRDPAKDIARIGEALLNSLAYAELLQTDRAQLRVQTETDGLGSVFCYLSGGTAAEQSLFMQTLREIVSPVDNPRYLIISKNVFLALIRQVDYHAVPEVLAKNKKLAEYFRDQWRHQVGSCELIFTRTIAGRKLLLKSRIDSLAARIQEPVELLNKWK